MTKFVLEEIRRTLRSPDHRLLIVCGAGISVQATGGKAPRHGTRYGRQRMRYGQAEPDASGNSASIFA